MWDESGGFTKNLTFSRTPSHRFRIGKVECSPEISRSDRPLFSILIQPTVPILEVRAPKVTTL